MDTSGFLSLMPLKMQSDLTISLRIVCSPEYDLTSHVNLPEGGSERVLQVRI